MWARVGRVCTCPARVDAVEPLAAKFRANRPRTLRAAAAYLPPKQVAIVLCDGQAAASAAVDARVGRYTAAAREQASTGEGV
jgi:hypothetical protein